MPEPGRFPKSADFTQLVRSGEPPSIRSLDSKSFTNRIVSRGVSHYDARRRRALLRLQVH